MRTLIFRLIVSIALLAGATSALAAACIPGSLASYVALGPTGCAVGAVNVAGFNSFPGASGGNAIPLDTIMVVPQNVDAASVGFDFMTTSSAGGFHVFRDFAIGYQLQGASFTSETVLLSGVELVGDGSATATLAACSNGLFSMAGNCIGTPLATLSRTVVRSPLNETGGSASQSFTATGSLAVITTLGLDSGQEGGARVAVTGDRFTFAAAAPVPEPSAYGMLLAGLLALGFVRRERLISRDVYGNVG